MMDELDGGFDMLVRRAKALGFEQCESPEDRESKVFCPLYNMKINKEYCPSKCDQHKEHWKCKYYNNE